MDEGIIWQNLPHHQHHQLQCTSDVPKLCSMVTKMGLQRAAQYSQLPRARHELMASGLGENSLHILECSAALPPFIPTCRLSEGPLWNTTYRQQWFATKRLRMKECAKAEDRSVHSNAYSGVLRVKYTQACCTGS